MKSRHKIVPSEGGWYAPKAPDDSPSETNSSIAIALDTQNSFTRNKTEDFIGDFLGGVSIAQHSMPSLRRQVERW